MYTLEYDAFDLKYREQFSLFVVSFLISDILQNKFEQSAAQIDSLLKGDLGKC